MEYPCLEEALKAKGIGPSGLKPLEPSVIRGCAQEVKDGAPLPMVASILTGFLILEDHQDEWEALQSAWNELAKGRSPWLDALVLKKQSLEGHPLSDVVNRLFAKEACSESDCELVIQALLDPTEEDLLKVILLQGLRVKRETDGENVALLHQICERSPHRKIDADVLLDWSIPYDGMARHEDISLECAAMLALLGLPVVLHGVRGLGPKFGASILDRVDVKTSCDLDLGQKALEACGVAMLDQQHVFPELFELLPLRNAMRKRPFLATMEKMLLPLRAKRNVMVTGYVHRAYRDSIPHMIHETHVVDELLLYKGLEGSVVCDPFKRQHVIHLKDGELQEEEMPRWDKPDVDTSVTSRWWLKEHHPCRMRLIFTVQQIFDRVIGASSKSGTIEAMIQHLDSGDFEDRLSMVRTFYPQPEGALL